MSYCRWSSDDFKCDVYAYHSVGDFYQIYVASNRYKGNVPEVPPINEVNREEWKEATKKRSEYLRGCETEKIGLPLDGKGFSCNTIEGFYEKMKEIKEAGYHIPEYVFERIEKEL